MADATGKQKQTLVDYLSRLPSGPVEEVKDLVDLLARCWEKFSGYDSEGMMDWKLHRIEQVEWNPPELAFVIERHGGTVMGSSRGELHHWTVDVQSGTASCRVSGYRQLYDRDKPLHVKPLVTEVAALVASGRNDPRLTVVSGPFFRSGTNIGFH